MKGKRILLSILLSFIFIVAYIMPVLAKGKNGTTLSASLTIEATWERVYNWSIHKTVSPDTWNLFVGDTGTSKYKVSVSKDGYTDKKYITGLIKVTNGGGVATQGLNIVANLTSPPSKETLTSIVVDVSKKPSLAPGETYLYPYTIIYEGNLGSTYKVTANVTITNHSGYLKKPFGPSPSNTIKMSGTPNKVVNDTIHVYDTNGDNWSFNNTDYKTYEKTFTCKDKGIYTNTATIQETGQTASATVTIKCYSLCVEKTADTSYTRKYNWTIDKTGDQSELTLTNGQTFTVNYTVTLDATFTDSNYNATGQITIFNPAPIDAVINSVEDIVSPDIKATVTGASFPYILEAGKTLTLYYTVDLPNNEKRTNTAIALLQNHEYHYENEPVATGTTEFTGTKTIDFTESTITETDKSITVRDDKYEIEDLGTLTYSKNTLPHNFNYSLNVGPYDTCGKYEFKNTASFVTNNTQTTGDDSWTVAINVPCSGATLTIGYWKNHAGSGSQPDMVTPLLPIWLGTENGSSSINVNSAEMAVNILDMKNYGDQSNGITKLYAQLLAAKLNIKNGADPRAVSSIIAEADAYLAIKDYKDWSAMDENNKKQILDWMSTLDNYNNGIIGPGHATE